MYCFIDAATWNDELRTRHVLNLDIMRLAEELGVEFAFPTQTLHVASLPGQPHDVPVAPGRDRLGEIVEGVQPRGERRAAGGLTHHGGVRQHTGRVAVIAVKTESLGYSQGIYPYECLTRRRQTKRLAPIEIISRMPEIRVGTSAPSRHVAPFGGFRTENQS